MTVEKRLSLFRSIGNCLRIVIVKWSELDGCFAVCCISNFFRPSQNCCLLQWLKWKTANRLFRYLPVVWMNWMRKQLQAIQIRNWINIDRLVMNERILYEVVNEIETTESWMDEAQIFNYLIGRSGESLRVKLKLPP